MVWVGRPGLGLGYPRADRGAGAARTTGSIREAGDRRCQLTSASLWRTAGKKRRVVLGLSRRKSRTYSRHICNVWREVPPHWKHHVTTRLYPPSPAAAGWDRPCASVPPCRVRWVWGGFQPPRPAGTPKKNRQVPTTLEYFYWGSDCTCHKIRILQFIGVARGP